MWRKLLEFSTVDMMDFLVGILTVVVQVAWHEASSTAM